MRKPPSSSTTVAAVSKKMGVFKETKTFGTAKYNEEVGYLYASTCKWLRPYEAVGLYAESDEGPVVERLHAFHPAFGGFVGADVHRVVVELQQQGALRVSQRGSEEGVAVAGKHYVVAGRAQAVGFGKLHGWRRAVDHDVLLVLPLTHGLDEVVHYGFAPYVAVGELVGSHALLEGELYQIGPLLGQVVLVWFGIGEQHLSVDQRLAVAEKVDFAPVVGIYYHAGSQPVLGLVGYETFANALPSVFLGQSLGEKRSYLCHTAAPRQQPDGVAEHLHGPPAVGHAALHLEWGLAGAAVHYGHEVSGYGDSVFQFLLAGFSLDFRFFYFH